MSSTPILQHLGAMRILLLAFAVLFLPMSFLTDMEPEGFGVVTAYVIPSVVTIFFFVLSLDVLMNRVFMSEKPEAEKVPHRTCVRANVLAIAALLVFWMPYYYGLVATYFD